jgi:hypothetical protein
MTVINNIEIDTIEYKSNTIKEAILNNDPIEEKLHVVIVVSNPCLYARRYILAREFIKRMECDETNILLYVVEFAYGNQKFIITDSKNKRHLQIRTETPIWHKENMINCGVRALLPSTWKAFAWIDADIEFESTTWALDTLKILNGSKDIVQLFSHALDMDKHKKPMTVFSSFSYQFCNEKKYGGKGLEYWHPGYAWACTRKAYEKMGGLYEFGILGSSDNIMALSLISNGIKAIDMNSTDGYKKTVLDFQNKVKHLRLGYIPGVIKHHFHGSKKNRKYTERWQILVKHLYDPLEHLVIEKAISRCNVLKPSSSCPKELISDIYNYFAERNEDEGYLE